MQAISILDKMPETDDVKKEKVKVRRVIVRPLFYLGYPEGSIEMIQAF